MVNFLIDAGAPLDGDEKHPGGPLLASSEAGMIKSVQMLLAAGAATDVGDRVGRTPEDLAAAGGHYQILKMLRARDGE